MDKDTIKPGMRVQTADTLSAKHGDFNVPLSQSNKRLSGVFGTVVSGISGDENAFWVEHDGPAIAIGRSRALNHMPDDDMIEKILEQRNRRAPYKVCEIKPV